jgi:glycosyltransferase involved in cell wall biosynthesis
MNRHLISILYFTITEVRGGVEEHILLLLSGLDRARFRPLLVCPPELAEKLRPDLPADVEFIPFPVQSSSTASAAWHFAGILRKHKVDILHSHMFQASRMASPIGRFCGVPLILETPHVREGWRRGWLKGSFVVDRLLSHSVDHYIAVSEANARYLTGEKGLPADKIVVIQPGTNLDRFDPTLSPPMDLKKNLGFAESDLVVLVIGRLEPQKGHRFLFDAFPSVREEFSQARLVCLSDGSLRGELERQAEALRISDVVHFAGYQADLSPWLALADICVLPSLYEGLPMSIVESLAAGRAVVATAVDGTPEVLLDGKTGLTVPPGDSGALATAICRMLRNPGERQSMAQAGRQWVLERFGKERMIRRTQDFYLQCWNQRGRGGEVAVTAAEAGAGAKECEK